MVEYGNTSVDDAARMGIGRVTRSNPMRTTGLASVAVLAVLACAPASIGQVPPGYQIVQVTDTPYPEFAIDLNNRGQIVFTAKMGADNSTQEIWLYDDNTGALTRLTNNSVQDLGPFINDAGTVTWSSYFGPDGPTGPTGEVMIRSPEGSVTRLTDDEWYDRVDGLNSLGQVVWSRWSYTGCANGTKNVMFYDGEMIHQITDNEFGNQSISVNDAAQILWTEFDFCPGFPNWRSLIKLYSDGVITTLSEPGLQAQYTSINNDGICAWMFLDPITYEEGIHIWENGVTTVLTNSGEGPMLNDLGDVCFHRWHSDTETWQVWLYRQGTFFQLTHNAFWSNSPVINAIGETVWMGGPIGEADVWFMRRFPVGDLNCDLAFDSSDIDPFFLAVGDAISYRVAFPDCDLMLADLNNDGAVDADDIDPFFAALGDGGGNRSPMSMPASRRQP